MLVWIRSYTRDLHSPEDKPKMVIVRNIIASQATNDFKRIERGLPIVRISTRAKRLYSTYYSPIMQEFEEQGYLSRC